MIIRLATKNDVQDIVAMIADDEFGKKREHFKIPLPNEYYTAFDNIDSDSNQELIVAVNDNSEIVGTLQLSFLQYLTYQGGVRAQIEAVRIKRDHRGTGIGTKMFEWAINRSKEKKAHMLQLTTDKKRQRAIKFYENLGFQCTHEGMKMHF